MIARNRTKQNNAKIDIVAIKTADNRWNTRHQTLISIIYMYLAVWTQYRNMRDRQAGRQKDG